MCFIRRRICGNTEPRKKKTKDRILDAFRNGDMDSTGYHKVTNPENKPNETNWRHHNTVPNLAPQIWSDRRAVHKALQAYTHKAIIHKYPNANRVIRIYISDVTEN